jgi:DHA2 family multidrug resistance protein-like MFS transporter
LLIGSMTITAVALVRHELRVSRPLLPVDLLRRPVFSLSVGTAASAFIAQTLMLVTIPFFLHEHVGLSVAAAGFCLAPWPLAAAVTGPIAGSLADRYSAGRLGGLGLALVCVGSVLVALSPAQTSLADILWRVAVCGLGFGFFQSPNNRLIISSTPKRRTSASGALIGTVRLTGQMIGASIAALTFALAASHGKALALFIAAGIALCAAGLSLTRVVAEQHSDGEARSRGDD